ncbi:MAG TPA: sulfatase-like hydrolase/transferase [Gemmata sp.]
MRVIVFALNGCPAGWLGAYGNDWVGTPHLDRLAAEAVTFDRHISDRPHPDAARRAWLGLPSPPEAADLPPGPLSEGRGSEDRSEPRPEPDGPGVGAELPLPSGRGPGGGLSFFPHTVLVRANHPDTDGPDWFYAGWGEVFDARPQPDDNSSLEELIRALPALLERLRDVPDFLLWIETDRLLPPWDVQQDVFEAYLDDSEEEPEPQAEEREPHEGADDEADGDEDGDEEPDDEPEDEPPGEEPDAPRAEEPEEPVEPFADPPTGPFDRKDLDLWDWLHKTFAAVVTKLDAELGALFGLLRAEGLDRSAAWVVTSDFGYPLGEHGQVGLFRPWLHQELVHLPLFLRLPGAEQAGRRVSGFTQPPDIFPTLLELFGAPLPADVRGFGLLPLARGQAEPKRGLVTTELDLGGAAEIALRTEDWALLVPTRAPEGDPPREPLLYEKPDDRWEVNDLRVRNIERADDLEALLREEIRRRDHG